MKIKVCGMRDVRNIAEVAEIGPDYMGFIFYGRSPRYCGDIDPSLIESLPDGIKPVMVTVDMSEERILGVARKYGFRIVQLHGDEKPDLCDSLRTKGFTVVKAVGMESEGSLKTLRRYAGHVDLFLLDTRCKSKGGSGKKFNWDILGHYDLEEDFWLSGGIGIEDAETLKGISHPHFKGIDLNSRFELSPGVKDTERLRSFFNVMSDHQL